MSEKPYKTVDYVFGPSQTIRAAIRRFNRMDMSEHQLELAMKYFNEENGKVVPVAGRPYKIPILTVIN